MLFCNKKKSTWLWITIFCSIKNPKLVLLCRKIRQNLFVHTEFQKLLYIDKILIVSIYLHSSSSEECQSNGIMTLRFVLLCAGLSLVLAVPHRQKRFLTDTGTRLKHFSINKHPWYETFYTAYFYLLRKKLLVNVLNYLNS